MEKITIGFCFTCDEAFEDDGTRNNCYCPKCGGSNYKFYILNRKEKLF